MTRSSSGSAPRSELRYCGRTISPFPTIDHALRGETFPFHTIFSLGLMRAWQSVGWADSFGALGPDAAWWHSFAPYVEDAINACSAPRGSNPPIDDGSRALERLHGRVSRAIDTFARDRGGNRSAPPQVIRQFLQQAIRAKVHSLYQELLAGADCLSSLCTEHGLNLFGTRTRDRSARPLHTIALNFVREGHTSAIIHASARDALGHRLGALAVNVARDGTAAADDLANSAAMLAEWNRKLPSAVAAVRLISSGRFPSMGKQGEAVVVVVDWLEGARELHVVRRQGGSRFVVVDDFVQKARALPRLSGAELGEDASHAVWSRFVEIRTRLAAFDWQREVMQAPTLELNEGDVVIIVNSPTIIAASTPPFRGAIGLWLYEAALAGARDDARSDGGRIYWAAPERALGAVRAAICHDMGKDAFRALVRRSGEMSIEDAATALRLCAGDELGLHILTNTHRLVAKW